MSLKMSGIQSIMGCYRMKITKRQLRRIIKEVMVDEPIRMRGGDSFPPRALAGNKTAPEPKPMPGSFSDTIVLSPAGDSVLVKGKETEITDVPITLEVITGFGMSDTDADNLIFALEDQMSDGYVELVVSYEDGKWGW